MTGWGTLGRGRELASLQTLVIIERLENLLLRETNAPLFDTEDGWRSRVIDIFQAELKRRVIDIFQAELKRRQEAGEL